MIKKILALVLAAVLLAGLAACAEQSMKKELQDAYVLITKSSGNPYNSHMATGFREAIGARGGRAVVLEPDKATAEAQIELIRSCIRGDVKAISIAANDASALDPILREAMAAGIRVSTMDSNTGVDSHAVFVNQVSADTLARCLMDAVYDLSGGGGTWAILSTTNQAGNQNAWIREMQSLMTMEDYSGLRLVDISFGEDNAELSKTKVRELLEEYPDLEVLCVPTVVGMRAAAEVLREQNSHVKLTGLGLPSEMADYMSGEEPVCPVMYLWDPISIGRLSAYVSLALTSGEITGTVGEILTTPDGASYQIVESPMGGSEVIVGEPQEFTPENIGQWREVF